MNSNGPVLGISLFSPTNEWQQRLYNLDGMLEKVAELGLGPAIEVVGFQTFRDYPDVSDETARHFRDLLDRYGLFPSCLGANLDMGRRRERDMTPEEALAYIERQIASAKKLGFPVMRIQISAGPDVLEKIAPSAEKAGVHVACELHSPLTVHHPEVAAMRERYDRIGSAYLGFIPDFSCNMVGVPEGFWNTLRHAGAREELIAAAKEIWKSRRPVPEKFAALAEASTRYGAGESLAGRLNLAIPMFGQMKVDEWADLLPYVRHIHGKYYEVDASGQEPSIPYPALMALLKKTGYRGTISAEWEGQAFTEEPIGFQQVQAWHAMCSRLLAN
jgi:sugar phosphate isomerase/epimerase